MGRRLGVLAVVLATLSTAAAAPPAHKEAKSGSAAGSGSGSAKATGSGSGSAADSAADSGSGSGSGSDAGSPEELPPHITGPQTVSLGNNISVDLPAGMILFESAVAKKILEAGGNPADNVLAMIISQPPTWSLTIDYDGVGYVSDSDADKLDADELLDNYKEGTKQQNEKRKQMGITELILDGWSEMPKYQKDSHHLVWGLKGHSTDGVWINFFTRVLGRNGYMSIDLVDTPDDIEKAKVAVQPLMNAIKFTSGARYEDHTSSDKS